MKSPFTTVRHAGVDRYPPPVRHTGVDRYPSLVRHAGEGRYPVTLFPGFRLGPRRNDLIFVIPAKAGIQAYVISE